MTKRKCATCGKYASKYYFTCSHNMLGFGFVEKGKPDNE